MGIRGLSSSLLLLFLLLSSPSPFFPPRDILLCVYTHTAHTLLGARAYSTTSFPLPMFSSLLFSATRYNGGDVRPPSVPCRRSLRFPIRPRAWLALLLSFRLLAYVRRGGRGAGTEDGGEEASSPSALPLSPAAASFLLLLVLFWRRRVGESGDGVPPPSALLPLLLCMSAGRVGLLRRGRRRRGRKKRLSLVESGVVVV